MPDRLVVELPDLDDLAESCVVAPFRPAVARDPRWLLRNYADTELPGWQVAWLARAALRLRQQRTAPSRPATDASGGAPVALKANTFENGVASGGNVTVANSDDTGGSALSLVNAATSGSITYSSAQAMHGSLSCLMSNATTNSPVIVEFSDTTATSFAARMYVYLTGYPSGGGSFGFRVQTSAAGQGVKAFIDTSGLISIVTDVTTYTNRINNTAMALNTWYRWEFTASGLTTSATNLFTAIYVGDSLTVADSITQSGVTTGATINAATMRFGRQSAVSMADYYVDDVAVNIGSSSLLGPSAAPATATPATAARTSAVPAPALLVGSTASPAAAGRAAAMPAVTITQTATATPSAVAAPAQIPPFAVSVSSMTDPVTLARPAAVGAPAIVTSATVLLDLPPSAGSATNTGTPISDDYVIATDADAADIAVGDLVQLYSNVGVLKSTAVHTVTAKNSFSGFTNIVVSPSFPTTSVAGDVLRERPTSRPASVPEPAIALGITVPASAVAAAASVPAIGFTSPATPQPAVVARAAAVPAVTVTASTSVSPAAVSRPAQVPAPGIGGGVAVTAPVVAAVAAVPAPALSRTATATPGAAASTAAVPAVVASGSTAANVATAARVSAVGAPTVATAGNASPAPDTVATVAHAADEVVVSAGAGAFPAPDTAARVAHISSVVVTATATASPGAVSRIALAPPPALAGGSVVSAVPVAAAGAVGFIEPVTVTLPRPDVVHAAAVVPDPDVEAGVGEGVVTRGLMQQVPV